MSTEATATRRIECYLRGDTYGTYDRQQAILNRVTGLKDSGVVADATVDASWQRIHTPELNSTNEALETYAEFREWADENGYSLEPAFERRQRSYIGTDVVHDVVVFPVASLAVYEGTDLQAVFPCSDEEGEIHFSVQDCLTSFEDGDDDWLDQFAPVAVDRAEPRLAIAD